MEPIKQFKMCATFFVWYCGFLARMWQYRHLRDLVKQGDVQVVVYLDRAVP